MRTVSGDRSARRTYLPIRGRVPNIGSTYHRLRVWSLAALAAPLALSAGPATASTLVISGAGEGHGVGMSQDGAFGYAQHGYSFQEILAHYYSGTALGQAPVGSYVRVLIGSKVERMPLERYVRGVVAAEMPSSWPLAALEAQAVASRTYALTAHAGGSRFDVYSDTRSQVYRGVAAETAQTNAAVAATAGLIVTYGGAPATTYFFASSGGMTENVENVFLGAAPEPWLRAVADPYDAGPAFRWQLSMSFATAAARLSGLVRGKFRGIEVLRRGVSPRIVSAEVLGSAGATPVSGPQLEARLGLADSWAYFGVKHGASVIAEPDLSGQPPSSASPASPSSVRAAAPRSAPARRHRRVTVTGPQGGTPAPARPPSTLAGGSEAG